ncbi:MAG: hypothetical protein OFPII_05300 [Osedax symbiont Rs1]|nr:MAG: hypothetical protein OFPII_05300 [Osedax symbiont Rs1]
MTSLQHIAQALDCIAARKLPTETAYLQDRQQLGGERVSN